MKTDCSLNYKFNTWKFQAQTWGEPVVYRNCFWHSEQFLYTTCSPHVLQKEELLTKNYLQGKCEKNVPCFIYWFEFGSSKFFYSIPKTSDETYKKILQIFVTCWRTRHNRNLRLLTLISAVELNPSNWFRSSNMVLWTSLSPAFSESKRLVPIASNSSMKMIAGDFSLAKAKASRTSLAPSPVIRDRVLVFDCQAERSDFSVHTS